MKLNPTLNFASTLLVVLGSALSASLAQPAAPGVRSGDDFRPPAGNGRADTLAAPGALADRPGFGPLGGGGPRGMMPAPELKLRATFDRDGNKLLDAQERVAAREFLAANPTPRRRMGPPGGGRGGPPGFGGFGGNRETPATGIPLTPADVKTYGTEPLFSPNILRTLFFTFDTNEWEKELETFHNTDVELPVTLQVDGKTYRDVGVHFRGASSYFMVGSGSKRSLGVSIDASHDDQDLLGHRTLNLLNAHGDPSFLRAVLFSQVAQYYLPTPRVNLVRVVINGENWGIYASAEQFNKDFTQDRFNTGKGARWKVPGSPMGRGSLEYLGDSADAYKEIYTIKSKDDPKSWMRLIQVCKVLNETPAEQLEAALAPLLDVTGALKFLALDNALVNSDGYWTRTSDYSIAEDASGRLHVVPHDMNETFSFGGGPGGRGPGGFAPPGRPVGAEGMAPPMGPEGRGGRGGRGGPAGGPGGGGVRLDPLISANNPNTPLATKLLAVPALRARYLGYVRDIAENWLDWSRLEPVAREFHQLIDADVKRDTRKLESYAAFVASLESDERSLRAFADQRRAFLLAHPEIKALAR